MSKLAVLGGKAVLSSWSIYACPPSRARLLTDAIAKIHENRKDLLAADTP